jgi:hypothetical protein
MAYVAILGRAPKSALAPEAQNQVDLAITHFEMASRLGSGRAKQALVYLTLIAYLLGDDRYIGGHSPPVEDQPVGRSSRGGHS